MLRIADIEMIIMRKEGFYTQRSLETECAAHRTTWGSIETGQETERTRGNGPEPLLRFSPGGTSKAV